MSRIPSRETSTDAHSWRGDCHDGCRVGETGNWKVIGAVVSRGPNVVSRDTKIRTPIARSRL
jgi:hypothetical protein